MRLRRRTAAGAAWIAGVVAVVELVTITGVVSSGADAWVAACRLPTPTPTQVQNNGIDLSASTHQWFATQAISILTTDGEQAITDFLATPDPMAPPANDPTTGAPTGQNETYGWRIVAGADETDCTYYSQVPDHLHNFWSHKGRGVIVGGSAATGAEFAFSKAVTAWEQSDRSTAMTWLGVAGHLVVDACVPQHNFFGAAVNHTEYEHWVLRNQDQLAVSDGAIFATDLRVDGGHGGQDWSSAHPRGWADECAHRAAAILLTASSNVAAIPSPEDPQWRTAPHIADTQRLDAGFIKFFFDTVGGP